MNVIEQMTVAGRLREGKHDTYSVVDHGEVKEVISLPTSIEKGTFGRGWGFCYWLKSWYTDHLCRSCQWFKTRKEAIEFLATFQPTVRIANVEYRGHPTLSYVSDYHYCLPPKGCRYGEARLQHYQG